MGRRLILDTAVLIAYERSRIDRTQFDDDDLAVAALSVAEYREGAERADTTERRDARLAVLADILAQVTVLDYTEATAVVHAGLLAHVRRSGRPRGAHDLILAAHAAQEGRILVSQDAGARFDELPGVGALVPRLP